MYRFTLVLVAAAASALLLYGLGRVVSCWSWRCSSPTSLPVGGRGRTPAACRGNPRRLSRGVAIGLVYVAISGVTWAGSALLLPTVSEQVSEAVSQAPGYAESLRTWQRAGRGPTSG